jgi:phage terminase large subunit
MRNYKWKSNGDNILDQPVKLYDDAMDALRYAIHYYHLRNKKGKTDFGFSSFSF